MAENTIRMKIKPTEQEVGQLKKHFRVAPSSPFNILIAESELRNLDLMELNRLGIMCMEEWVRRAKELGATPEQIEQRVWGVKK